MDELIITEKFHGLLRSPMLPRLPGPPGNGVSLRGMYPGAGGSQADAPPRTTRALARALAQWDSEIERAGRVRHQACSRLLELAEAASAIDGSLAHSLRIAESTARSGAASRQAQ